MSIHADENSNESESTAQLRMRKPHQLDQQDGDHQNGEVPSVKKTNNNSRCSTSPASLNDDGNAAILRQIAVLKVKNQAQVIVCDIWLCFMFFFLSAPS